MAASPIKSWLKTPTGVLDYSLDWTRWLQGDTIASITVVSSTPATLVVSATTFGTGVVTAWFSGGVDGVNYTVVYTITTAAGRTDSRTVQIQVRVR